MAISMTSLVGEWSECPLCGSPCRGHSECKTETTDPGGPDQWIGGYCEACRQYQVISAGYPDRQAQRVAIMRLVGNRD